MGGTLVVLTDIRKRLVGKEFEPATTEETVAYLKARGHRVVVDRKEGKDVIHIDPPDPA